ncbi:potassium channel family protein [Kribbella sp. NPDC026596]|uniref:potassium channel family protein n=1 Tax=Kribbella sp. NPDC026596 TaxID=3155122 RepID=UPI003400E671
MKDAEASYRRLSKGERHRLARTSLLRSLLVSVVIVVGYYVLPMNLADDAVTVYLAVGLVVVTLVLFWQLRDIARSPYPRIRAIGALATSVPLFLVVFAATYYVIGQTYRGSFSEPLTRTDSMYFTVTVFSTVGFGDIVPISEAARVVTMVQMFGDLLIVGIGAKALLTAVQAGLNRRHD